MTTLRRGALNLPPPLSLDPFAVDRLVDTYETFVRDGRARGRDGIAPEGLKGEIWQLCERISTKLQDGTYRFTRYREQLKLKDSGSKPRLLSIPTARDRIALRALAEHLGAASPRHRNKIPQHCVMDVFTALQDTPFDTYIRLDVRAFYSTIPHDYLEAALDAQLIAPNVRDIVMRAVRTPTVADRVNQRTKNPVGVPQGLAVSNILAEFVAHDIDEAIIAIGQCDYFRYVDDVLILCRRRDAPRFAREARQIFRSYGLELHKIGSSSKSKIDAIGRGFSYLGYKFEGSLISVREASVYNLEARIARAFTVYKRAMDAGKSNPSRSSTQRDALQRCEMEVNLIITGFTYKREEIGWIQYYRQMNDYKLLNQLDATVRRFKRRFGVPPSFRFKQFTRAYWAARHPNVRNFGYIPNFDKFTVAEQRTYVQAMLGPARSSAMDDYEVAEAFIELAHRFSANSERDIGRAS